MAVFELFTDADLILEMALLPFTLFLLLFFIMWRKDK